MTLISQIALFLLVGCAALAEPPSVPQPTLRFFVVSDTSFDGGRAVSVFTLSLSGFAKSTPDLVITSLEFVRPGLPSTNSLIDRDGKTTDVSSRPTLIVGLKPADAARFAELSERAVGKRLLVSLGDKPLMAPFVRSRIDSTSILMVLGTDSGDAAGVERQLEKLVVK